VRVVRFVGTTRTRRARVQRLLRDDDLRDDVLRAVARPPRAPAVRTDILPEPLLLAVDFVEDFERRAATRPPFAPAFFFCATLPARPPFAPAFLTEIVPRPVFLRVELVLARDDDVFERDVVVFREREVPVVLFEERLPLAFRAVVVPDFLRDDVPPPREAEDDLRDEPLRPDDDRDDEDEDEADDFVSPACERCLLTVRAAISFARFVDRPCFFSESLMCSYCRSRFALHASGICV